MLEISSNSDMHAPRQVVSAPSSSSKKKPITYKLTVLLVDVYSSVNPKFRLIDKLPQRMLSNPSIPAANNNRDNIDANLICRVNDRLEAANYGFIILDLLGTGTFGQVFRCLKDDGSKEICAVKVVKNKPAYYSQGQLEIKIASYLNTRDPYDERHIVRLQESFEYLGHVCLVFELLSMSLLDILTQNQFRGLPLTVVQRFTRQILSALVVLEDCKIIHCDLKPENILLCPPKKNKPQQSSHESNHNEEEESGKAAKKLGALAEVKLIDFGSACYEGRTMYSYIQSRFYRSPEVLIGLPYHGAIDTWSLGCVCAEMYLGLPIFPGVSQHNQLTRIVEMLGSPPDVFIEKGKNGSKYFCKINAPKKAVVDMIPFDANKDHSNNSTTATPIAIQSNYRLKTAEEYAAETSSEVPVLRKYLRYTKLEDVIMKCPLANKSKLSQAQKADEIKLRRCFLDFIEGLLKIDPIERWTARQAAVHPFITNAPFTGQLPNPPTAPPDTSALKTLSPTPATNITSPIFKMHKQNSQQHLQQQQLSQIPPQANRQGNVPHPGYPAGFGSLGGPKSTPPRRKSVPHNNYGSYSGSAQSHDPRQHVPPPHMMYAELPPGHMAAHSYGYNSVAAQYLHPQQFTHGGTGMHINYPQSMQLENHSYWQAAGSYSRTTGYYQQGTGSMQQQPYLTDFGQALIRPDMNEHRRMMSQQEEAVYWQNMNYSSSLGSNPASYASPRFQNHFSRTSSFKDNMPRSRQGSFSNNAALRGGYDQTKEKAGKLSHTAVQDSVTELALRLDGAFEGIKGYSKVTFQEPTIHTEGQKEGRDDDGDMDPFFALDDLDTSTHSAGDTGKTQREEASDDEQTDMRLHRKSESSESLPKNYLLIQHEKFMLQHRNRDSEG